MKATIPNPGAAARKAPLVPEETVLGLDPAARAFGASEEDAEGFQPSDESMAIADSRATNHKRQEDGAASLDAKVKPDIFTDRLHTHDMPGQAGTLDSRVEKPDSNPDFSAPVYEKPLPEAFSPAVKDALAEGLGAMPEADEAEATLHRRIRVSTGVKHLLLILLCVFAVFPIYWMIMSSFKGTTEIFNNSLFPQNWSLENYQYALGAIDIGNMTVNTFLMAAAQTILQLTTAVMAAYALTRWNFPGSKLIYAIFALTWLVPFQATMIPNYATIAEMGLRNSLMGVILPNMASAFAILSLYPAFKSFPKALVEAGMMDRMSAPGVLFKLILPNMKSSIVSLGILLFINSWNDYFWPAMIISEGQQTLQIGLRSFMSAEVTSWGPMMAASVLASLPIFVLYLIIQKQVIQSFVKWGIK